MHAPETIVALNDRVVENRKILGTEESKDPAPVAVAQSEVKPEEENKDVA